MCTKLFFWNVRGLNDPDKHAPFCDWLKFHQPIFGSILETHIKDQNLTQLMPKLCYRWNYISNHSSDEDGRIIVIWKDPVKVRVLSQSRQQVTCEVLLPATAPFTYTAIYGSNERVERAGLWVELLHLYQWLNLSNIPWILGGDFNEIIHHSEHSLFEVNSISPQMAEFRDSLHQMGMFDLRFQGPLFTWSNHQPDSPITKKLDRLLVNSHAISLFPNSTTTFLPPEMSDHCPCILDLAHQLPLAGTKPFRFFNYLTKHPLFHQSVLEAWNQAGSMAFTLTNLCWKQKSVKGVLKRINRENFSNIQVRVLETNSLLQAVQVQALQTPSPQLLEDERQLHQKWLFLRQIEESYFRQKSRVNWLGEGDQNTAYFFRIFQTRTSYNTIRSFLLSSGVMLTDPYLMSLHAIAHFQNFLGPDSLQPLQYHSPPSWFAQLSSFRPSQLQATAMTTIPSAEEIQKLLFKLNPNKAPGPDGLTSAFYKSSWSFLGLEVLSSITHFFHQSFMPASTNSTILALVPKRPGASSISDFRPISLLNTLYKLIARLLVRRIKPMLSDLIVPNQTAFVKDRLIVENTVLAGELVHGYHKKKGPKRITIKVDIAKAFDTLSWEFLLNCLIGLQLPPQLILWLKACICTPNFTVGYNGRVHGYFKGKRGLRQGDPLSPYLFVIAMNILSLMLNKAAADLKIKYHHKCSKSKLTHLCFADDLLIFMDGSIDSVQNVLQVLKEFEFRSGLAVSVQKSSFYASGLSQQEIDAIKASTGMPNGTLPVRYLGVPLCTKKLTIANCEFLIQQVKAKFSSWSVKTLSFAGRLLLIKTVIAGINNFWCSTFILPKACVKRINSLCGLFLWKGKMDAHHSAKVSWETVTKDKSCGGLGVKDLKTWNKACCIKLIWLLFFQAGSIWVGWFKTEVLKGSLSNFWTMKPTTTNSWLANKLFKLRDEVYTWIKLKVGNGESCRFWSDNWTPFGKLSHFILSDQPSRMGITLNSTVSDLLVAGNWTLPPARSESMVQLHIYLTSLTLTEEEDSYEWVVDDKRSLKYSTNKVYRQLRGHETQVPWDQSVWNAKGIPRHSFLTWLFVLNRCPTRDRLRSWGLQTDATCLLCNQAPESRDHLFYRCPFSGAVWEEVARRCNLQPQLDWDQTMIQMQSLQGSKYTKRLTLLCWQAGIYWIWQERNKRLHTQQFRSSDVVIPLIIRQITDRISSFRHKSPAESSRYMQLWFSTHV